MRMVDWSSFLPDLIVGVITGVLVGLALYIFEKSRHRAETRAQTLAGWSMVAPRIERIVWQPLLNDTTSYAELGPVLTRARDIADGYPLEYWQQALKRDDLARLLDLLSEYDSLQIVAEKVEGLLESAGYSKGIDAEIGSMVCIVARAQTYADTDEQILAMFAPPNDFMLKFVPLALSLRDHAGYARAEQDYMGARIRTGEAQTKFLNALRLARSVEFNDNADHDERRKLRRAYLRHPFKTRKRVRYNRSGRNDSAL